jgi:hypothetical protein
LKLGQGLLDQSIPGQRTKRLQDIGGFHNFAELNFQWNDDEKKADVDHVRSADSMAPQRVPGKKELEQQLSQLIKGGETRAFKRVKKATEETMRSMKRPMPSDVEVFQAYVSCHKDEVEARVLLAQ